MKTEELNRIFRENLRAYRKRLNMSQNELSEKAGITEKFYNDIETGKKWGSFDTLTAIADSLGVEPYELLLPQNQAVSYDSRRTKQLMARLRVNLNELVDTVEGFLKE